MGNLNNLSIGGLLIRPSYDYEVEYIEKTSDTPSASHFMLPWYVPTGNAPVFECKCMLIGFYGGTWNGAIYNAYTSGDHACYRILRCNNGTNVRFCHNQKASGGYQKDNYRLTLNTVHTIRQAHDSLTIDGTGVTGLTTTTSGDENTACIAVLHGGIRARIYSFKVYEGDVCIFDVIPVKRGDRCYLYDKVRGRLLRDNGYGGFVAGNRKQ